VHCVHSKPLNRPDTPGSLAGCPGSHHHSWACRWHRASAAHTPPAPCPRLRVLTVTHSTHTRLELDQKRAGWADGLLHGAWSSSWTRSAARHAPLSATIRAAASFGSRWCAGPLEGLLRFCPSACLWRIPLACCDFMDHSITQVHQLDGDPHCNSCGAGSGSSDIAASMLTQSRTLLLDSPWCNSPMMMMQQYVS
jgi:hypothetical protein